MRKKNGSIGNAPGDLSWMRIAEPSSSVMTAARPAISQRSFRRRVGGSLAPHYVSLLIRSKIGRYIEMTMPPTMRPRKAIITGSMSVSSPATAVSTSSS
jgi:hypothetical protein